MSFYRFSAAKALAAAGLASQLACGALTLDGLAQNGNTTTTGGNANASTSTTGGTSGTSTPTDQTNSTGTTTGTALTTGSVGVGATLPFIELEAEAATTTGTIISPNRTFGSFGNEASGRSAVQLTAQGQYVSFTTPAATNSIVVRYSIPDAPSGGGMNATLGLYVGSSARKDLALTSRYSWTYGDQDAQGTGSESPGNGTPHHFYDEVHLMFDQVPAGTTIKLQRDAQDTASFYVIDLVDFELVAAPLTQPTNSLSIVDYGATPDDSTDDSAALAACIAAAQTQGKDVWIPQGRFEMAPYDPSAAHTPKINTSGVTIRGAGMWYSMLHGFGAQFQVTGNNNKFYNFALFGDITYRDDTKGWQGLDGPAGTGSHMENVWIEHQTVGWWVGKGAFVGQVTTPLTNGLVIHGVRIRNTYADGVNFANATANSTVEQSSFRNTGDDSIATWSYSADGPTACQNNTFQFNTVQTVWRANCIALYGGTGTTITDNYCADTSNYPGLLVSTTFSAIPFAGTTNILRNSLVRAGGPHYGQEFGALRFFADTATVSNINVTNMEILDATYSGIHFGGAQQQSNVALNSVAVKGYGTEGVWVSSEAHGAATFNNVTISGGANVPLKQDAPNAFTLTMGSGNVGF